MKCPRCGASNPGDQLVCYRCGAKLSKEKDDEYNSSSLWNNDAPKKSVKRKQKSVPTIALDDESKGAFFEKDSRITSSAKTNRERLKEIKDGKSVNVILPPEQVEYRTVKKRRIKWFRLFIIVLLVTAILFGVGFGGYKLVKYIADNVDNYRESIEEATAPKPPLVERIMEEGEPWHSITFYGDEGDYILVTTLHRTLPIHDGEAVLLIDDLGYIPDDPDPDVPTITIAIEALKFDEAGNETPVNVPSFNIDVPISPLSMIFPAEQGYTTSETRIDISMKVDPGSRVMVNQSNLSALISDEGYVSNSVGLEAIGNNVIKIVIETPKHRINSYDLIVNHPVMDVPITILSENKGYTSSEKITIQGTIDPGNALEVDAPLSGDIQLDPLTGAFEFTVKLPQYGWNRITMTASDPSGQSSELIYTVDRRADMATYTRSAWSLVDNFDYLTVATDALIGKEFKCVGTITKILSADTRNIYQMDVGTADNPMLIAIEYEGSLNIDVDTKYEMFADVRGSFEQYPLLMAQFVKVIPDEVTEED